IRRGRWCCSARRSTWDSGARTCSTPTWTSPACAHSPNGRRWSRERSRSRALTSVDCSHAGLFVGEYRLPVTLHVDDGPASGPGLIEASVEPSEGRRLPVVGPLTVRIRVVDIETESRPATGGRPVEHWQVTVCIAERGDGAPANVHLDADRLALPVI